MGVSKTTWSVVKNDLCGIALGVTGRRIQVVDITDPQGSLGYTALGQRIFLNANHEIMSGMNQVESIMFMKGVFTHELMHQLATDFPTFESEVYKTANRERKILQTLFNVMEDPAIEHLASRYIGGHLLRALSFSIMHCYKLHPGINPESSPFTQFIDAAILYGDGGLLKGKFGSKEAKRYFFEALPIFDKAISEINAAKRVLYAKEVFELTRPLWQPEVQESDLLSQLLDELSSHMSSVGKSTDGTSDGCVSEPDGSVNSESENFKKKEKRRKITFHEISKEEAEEMGFDKGKPSLSALPDGDIDLYVVKDSNNFDVKSGESTPLDCESNGEFNNDVAGNSNHDAEISEVGISGFDKDYCNPAIEEGIGEITDEEYEMTPEDVKNIKNELAEIREKIKIEKEEKQSYSELDLDVPEMKVYYQNVSCKNVHVKAEKNSYLDTYQNVVNGMTEGIVMLTNQLKRIFKNDMEEREYRYSGRINVKRLSNGTLTSRVFDRKVNPKNKSDICVMLLVDQSGSMEGSKIRCARNTVIGLSEVFGKLNIPTGVIGFTNCSRTVQQYHYLHWKNTLNDRIRLLRISAENDNFDGYSIRYATKLLEKRHEQHKILIVISDGLPACSYYRSFSHGVTDTSQAIREAEKVADVIGVAVHTDDTDVLHDMYRSSFLQVDNENELFQNLSRKIKEKIKGW